MRTVAQLALAMGHASAVPAALVADGSGRIVHRISPRDLETDAALRAAIVAP